MIGSNIGNKGNSEINQYISWNYDLYHEEGTMFGNLYSLPLSNNFKCARNKISTKIKKDEFNILYPFIMSYKGAYLTLIVTISWSGVITLISYLCPQLIEAL